MVVWRTVGDVDFHASAFLLKLFAGILRAEMPNGSWHSKFCQYFDELAADCLCFHIWQLLHNEISKEVVDNHQMFHVVALNMSVPIFSHGHVGISGCMMHGNLEGAH